MIEAELEKKAIQFLDEHIMERGRPFKTYTWEEYSKMYLKKEQIDWWESFAIFCVNKQIDAVKKVREEVISPAKMFRKVMADQIPDESLKPLLDQTRAEGIATGKKEAIDTELKLRDLFTESDLEIVKEEAVKDTARKIFEEIEKSRDYCGNLVIDTFDWQNFKSRFVGQAKNNDA